MNAAVYGVGNPLIDVIVPITDTDLFDLGIHKGTMHLIDENEQEGLIRFISGREISYSSGGSCPNTIITLSALGITSALGGMVGDDEYGRIYREELQKSGAVDELRSSGSRTGSSIILVTPDSERTMNTFLGANRDFGPDDLCEERIRQADFFHFTGYMWDTASQKQAIMRALEIARSAGTRVSFDVADPFAVSRNREAFMQIISDHADIVFANKEEARILFDNYDAYECSKSLGKSCHLSVVKNGRLGSYVNDAGSIEEIPVQGGDPVDTTGAGDTYAAGFLYGLCTGKSPADAGTCASFLAGEVISLIGARFPAERIVKLRARLETI